MNRSGILRLPAEFETHEATWIAWPHNKTDWPGKFSAVKWIYAEIVKYISRDEEVRILVQSKEHQKRAENVLRSVDPAFENRKFFIKKTNRSWLRDSSPFFVKDKRSLAAIDFKFNAWSKYNDYKLDDTIPSYISKKFGIRKVAARYKSRNVVLEGGSVDVNGSGTLITTEECLLDQKIHVRNPELTAIDYEEIFDKYFGVSNVIWLGKGIEGDDTHGHVDDICRFVKKDTVVIVQEGDSSDENYEALTENMERLQTAKLEDGSKLCIVELPMPSPVVFRGERLPASYANFYITNHSVLVPTFNDPNDRTALGVLSELFPDRKVIGIHSVDLVWGLGTIHCLTHEQPAG
jgi:agmatine deiminase